MKKILLSFFFVVAMLATKAQIIITGFIANPSGGDQNYEYVQLMATQNINFSTNPYSLVTCRNGTTTAPNAGGYPLQGWATGGDRTYQINMSSGSVVKGQIFYVGGIGKKINGSSSQSFPLDVLYIGKDIFEIGDNGNGNVFSGSTGMLPNSGRAAGIAVFNTISVTYNTEPIDVVFIMEAGTGGGFYTADNGAGEPRGYTITNNDLYSKSASPYYRQSSDINSAVVLNVNSANDDSPYFFNLGGDYNSELKQWLTPRNRATVDTKTLVTNSSTLSAIEKLPSSTTLLVTFKSFSAIANKNGSVNLAWSTSSEQNNSHFELLRSSDGKNYTKIGEVAGNGTTNVAKNYSFIDHKANEGINYYQLKQVDFDGKFAYTKIVAAKVGFGANSLSVSKNTSNQLVSVNYIATKNGQASFTIYNAIGSKVASKTQTVLVGKNKIEIPLPSASATFILEVKQSEKTQSIKF